MPSINNTTTDFARGQLLGAAGAVLTAYDHLNQVSGRTKQDVIDHAAHQLQIHSEELVRLCNNQIQIRNDWGDTIQLAGLVVLLTDGYISSALKA
jgi:hypothetical protein